MILVLNNADFSDNNIGKVELDEDLNPNVVSILSHLTRFTADKHNEYVQAFNKLYNGLVEAELLAKLKLLSIPSLSSDISECGYNVITGDLRDVSAIYKLDTDYELKIKGNVTTGQASGTFNIESTPTDDVSLFGILYKHSETLCPIISAGRVQSGGNRYLNLLQRWNNNGNDVFSIQENRENVYKTGGTSGRPIGNYTMPLPETFVTSWKNGSVIYKYDNSVVYGTPETSSTDTITLVTPLAITDPTPSTPPTAGYAIFGAGVGLTETEVNTLHQLLEDFKGRIE